MFAVALQSQNQISLQQVNVLTSSWGTCQVFQVYRESGYKEILFLKWLIYYNSNKPSGFTSMQKAPYTRNDFFFLSCMRGTCVRLWSVPESFLLICSHPWIPAIKSVIYIAAMLNLFLKWHKSMVRIYFAGIMSALCVSFFSKSGTCFILLQFMQQLPYWLKKFCCTGRERSPCMCICTSTVFFAFWEWISVTG